MKDEYKNAAKSEKSCIAKRILQWVRGRGGRFLAAVKGGGYAEGECDTALEKVKRALRDDKDDETHAREACAREDEQVERVRQEVAGQVVSTQIVGRTRLRSRSNTADWHEDHPIHNGDVRRMFNAFSSSPNASARSSQMHHHPFESIVLPGNIQDAIYRSDVTLTCEVINEGSSEENSSDDDNSDDDNSDDDNSDDDNSGDEEDSLSFEELDDFVVNLRIVDDYYSAQ
jgi:hypothetical protein